MMRVVPKGSKHLAKRACYICEGNRSELVDTEQQIEGEGYLGICKGCASTIATLFDWAPPALRRKLEDALAEANERVKALVTDLGIERQHREALAHEVQGLRARVPATPREPVNAVASEKVEPKPGGLFPWNR